MIVTTSVLEGAHVRRLSQVVGVYNRKKLGVRTLLSMSQTFAQPQAQQHPHFSFCIFLPGHENPLARGNDCYFACKSISTKTGEKNNVTKKKKNHPAFLSACPAGLKETTRLAQAISTGLMTVGLGYPSSSDSSD